MNGIMESEMDAESFWEINETEIGDKKKKFRTGVSGASAGSPCSRLAFLLSA